MFFGIIFRDKNTIEFRAENIDQVLNTTAVATHEAGQLYTVLDSTLLFVGESTSPRKVHWMDCSTGEPKVLQKVVATEFKEIWDIQFAQKERLFLVIAKPGSLGFHAYHEDSGALKWSVVGSLPGIEKKLWPIGLTVDEKGRLFVCDSVTGNNCIQMFRVVDGNYLRCLIKKG